MIRAWPECGRRSGALWERRENVVAFAVNLAVVVLVGLCPTSGSCSSSIRRRDWRRVRSVAADAEGDRAAGFRAADRPAAVGGGGEAAVGEGGAAGARRPLRRPTGAAVGPAEHQVAGFGAGRARRLQPGHARFTRAAGQGRRPGGSRGGTALRLRAATRARFLRRRAAAAEQQRCDKGEDGEWGGTTHRRRQTYSSASSPSLPTVASCSICPQTGQLGSGTTRSCFTSIVRRS